MIGMQGGCIGTQPDPAMAAGVAEESSDRDGFVNLQTQMYQEVQVQEVPAGDYILRRGQAFGPYIFLVIDGEASLVSSGHLGNFLCVLMSFAKVYQISDPAWMQETRRSAFQS